MTKPPVQIFLVDDDDEDAFLIQEAINQISSHAILHRFKDGVSLMDFLHGRTTLPGVPLGTKPQFILMDLAMPKKDGKQALVEIKNHPDLKQIPVVMLSTSSTQEDVTFCYKEGANSFAQKPPTWEGLLQLMTSMCLWWGQSVILP